MENRNFFVLSLTRRVHRDFRVAEFAEFVRNCGFDVDIVGCDRLSIRFADRVRIDRATSEFDVLSKAYRVFRSTWQKQI